MRQSSFVAVIALLMMGATTFFGCGRGGKAKDRVPVYKAGGTVTYKGNPVEGAIVRLMNSDREKPGASGSTNAKGEFKLTTYEGDDGAAVGKYVVLISKPERGPGAPKSGSVDSNEYVPPPEAKPVDSDAPVPQPKNLLPAKYLNAARTDLSADITAAGPNQLTFELKD